MLLERDAELAAIGDRLDEGGLVVVEGAAGIGKTSLLAAAAERAAAHGTRVLVARAAPLEQAYGFGVVRQLFEPVRAGCDAAEWQRLTADAAGLALRALDPAAAVAAPGDDVTHATLHGLFWLAANLAAQGPLVLAVDDAHWADPPSLRWLGYLARRLEGLPVLALVAVRTGEPPSEPRLLDDLLAEPRALLLRPRPLGPDSSAAVVRGRIGDAAPEFCTACHDATGGNPFLLEALIASVRAEGVGADARAADGIVSFGPEAVARALDRRLERLGARELARSLAVLGDDAAPREVAALAGLDAADAARVSDALRAAGVSAPAPRPKVGDSTLRAGPVAGRGPQLAFAHPILRAAVVAGLGPGERALWHSRAAELLWGEDADPERVAVQLLEAEPSGDQDAVRALRAAARAAAARGAPESATAYLRRALAEPPGPVERPAVLLELGLALAAHRHPDSPALLHEAVESIADAAARGAAAVRAARALGLAALYADVVEICRRTLADADDLPPDDVARLEAELIGIGMTRSEGHEEIRALVDRIRRDPPAVPLWRVVAAAADAYDVVPARESIALVRPLLREEVLAAERESLVATVVLMFVLIWNDDLDAAKGVADGLLAAARPRGWASAVANGSFMRALAQVRRGEVADAEADIRPAFEFKLSVSPPDSLAWALLPLVDTLVERDELDEAERALVAGRAEVLTPDLLVFPHLMEARARLRLAQGRPEEALADARAAAASWKLHGTDCPGLAGWRVCAAEALVALGDTAAALELAREQLALAEHFGAAGPLGAALRAVARSSPPAKAIAPLDRAVAVLRDSAAQLEHMRALVELGAALRRRGRREAAREPLREALHLADRGGAVRLAARAREELRAAGARPRRTALSGRDALTPAERRVVALAAEGHTNRQIAQQLFVTQRTVETHLTHAFAKLDVTSRDQLAAALWPVEERAYAVT